MELIDKMNESYNHRSRDFGYAYFRDELKAQEEL